MADSNAGAAVQQTAAPKKKRKWPKRLVILAVVLALAWLGVQWFGGRGHRNAVMNSAYMEAPVERRDIVSQLSYSGTLEPADSYTVTSLVSGEILGADFEEGDIVAKDDVLYTIDDSDAATGVERAENSLSQAQRSYSQVQRSLGDLNITAPAGGQLVELSVEVGDDVTAGQTVAVIRDSASMTIKLPFPADEAAAFYVGQSAQVTADGSFETLNGTVTAVSASDSVLSGNRIVRIVTIEVQNPGAVTSDTMATAIVGGSACAESAAFTYKAEKNVTASVSGTVSALSAAEGAVVSKGQLLVSLRSDSLNDQLASAGDQIRDAQISLENQRNSLDNYIIQSPIEGTVIDKSYKQGDKISEGGKQLCTIFDLSYLSFTMYVDELDIKQVAVGQKVQITADAVEGQAFEGQITKVSINGTTANGATTYPVTVRIDEMGDLLPGMNVDASVVIAEAKDVLSVPVEAVDRAGQVLVKTSDVPPGGESEEDSNGGLPAGYAYQQVELGLSDDSYVEIVSGLSEGDQVAYQQTSSMGGMFASFAMSGGGPEGGPPPDGGGGPGGGY